MTRGNIRHYAVGLEAPTPPGSRITQTVMSGEEGMVLTTEERNQFRYGGYQGSPSAIQIMHPFAFA